MKDSHRSLQLSRGPQVSGIPFARHIALDCSGHEASTMPAGEVVSSDAPSLTWDVSAPSSTDSSANCECKGFRGMWRDQAGRADD